MIYQLIGIRGPQSGRVFSLSPGQVLWLGRTPEATVPISSVLASRRHAEIRVEAGGVVLRDLGSSNGTRVNGQKISARPLGPGDVVEIGDEAFRFAWASAESGVGPSRGQIVVVRGPLAGRSFGLGTATVSFGRGADCTVIVQSQRASRRHAEIRFEAAGVVLHDLGSGNGTFVNGKRATAHPLAHGDLIEIGDEAFRFDATPSSTRMRAAVAISTVDGTRQTIPTIDPRQISWDGSVTQQIVAQVQPPPAVASTPPQPAAPVAPVAPAQIAAPPPQVAAPPPPAGPDAAMKLSVRCPRCRRVVDARYADCPWDGAALVNGKSVL